MGSSNYLLILFFEGSKGKRKKMSIKNFAIETLEIAEWNVLKAIFRLKPKDLEHQITPRLNPIRWIIGHLALQMDSIFSGLCQGSRKTSQAFRDYYTAKKEELPEKSFPVSYKELIDFFLEMSKNSFQYLRNLPEEKFQELPEKNKEPNTETVKELIQRVALHFLGHTGQIYFIKRDLSKGGYFVAGVKKEHRDVSRTKWLKWWDENKENYH